MRGAIPGPKGKWLIGDTLAYESDRLGWLLRTRERYGDIVRLAPSVVVLHDPKDIHTVLSSAAAMPGHVAMTGKQSMTEYLPRWTEVRQTLWRHLDRSFVSAHLNRIQATFATRLQESSGAQTDVFPFALSMCIAATVDFCAGTDSELTEATKALFHSLFRASTKNEPRVGWLPRSAAKATTHQSDHLERLLLTRINSRRRSPSATPSDLIDALPPDLPGPAAAQVLRSTLMASAGTPAAAATWTLLRLAEHPGLAQRASDASFAAAFAKEVLRLHPPNWLLVRHTVSTLEVGGYPIAPGSEILLPLYHVHRDARWWKQPEAFAPDRWQASSAPHSPHAYLPFGAGSRMCPGGHLAAAQLTALIQAVSMTGAISMPRLADVPVVATALLLPMNLRGSWDSLGVAADPVGRSHVPMGEI